MSGPSAKPPTLSTTGISLSREARLLLLSAGGAENDPAMGALLQGPVDWELLLELGVAEGAHPELGNRLRSANAHALPASATALWSPVERITGFRMGYLERRMRDALTRLSAAGIPLVLLKGAAMALTTHRSFAERPMSDVDLLVKPEHLLEARQLLLGSGWSAKELSETQQGRYVGKHHLPPLFDAEAPRLEIGIELHTDLFSATRNPFRVAAPEIWRTALPLSALGEGVMVPDPHHALLHCCLHYSWSHLLRKGSWRTFRDIAAVCRSGVIDWDRFATLAEGCGGATACYWSLRLGRTLSGAAVPDEVLEALRPPGSKVVIASLEHHFAQEALETERRCPSARLGKLMWIVAHRPRASGHGGRRPWTGRPLDDGVGPDARVRSRSGARPLGRLVAWTGYLLSVARAGLRAGRRSPSPSPSLSPASSQQ